MSAVNNKGADQPVLSYIQKHVFSAQGSQVTQTKLLKEI